MIFIFEKKKNNNNKEAFYFLKCFVLDSHVVKRIFHHDTKYGHLMLTTE